MSFKEKRNKVLKEKLRSIKKEVKETREIVSKVKAEIENLFKEKYFPEEKINKKETDITASDTHHSPMGEEEETQQEKQTIHEQNFSEDHINESSNNSKKAPELRKMFKSIAKETHPDVINEMSKYEKREKKKLFDQARRALEEDDHDVLVEICEKLGLEVPDLPENYYEQVDKKIKSLMDELVMLHSTLFWQWFMTTGEKRKESILNEIFKRMQDYIRS